MLHCPIPAFRIGSDVGDSLAAGTGPACRRANERVPGRRANCRAYDSRRNGRSCATKYAPRFQAASFVASGCHGPGSLRRLTVIAARAAERTSARQCDSTLKDGRKTIEKRLEIIEIFVRQAIVKGNGKGRQIMCSHRGNAPTQRSARIPQLPAADAGFSVRGYVGRKHRSVRRCRELARPA